MTGADLIHLAGDLVTEAAGREAYVRCATSRAYYGAFHLARDLILDIDSTVSPLNHGTLPQCLARSNQPEALKAAQMLSDLQSNRVLADYALDKNKAASPKFAMMNVQMARKIQSILQTLADTPELRTSLQAGIKRVMESRRAKID